MEEEGTGGGVSDKEEREGTKKQREREKGRGIEGERVFVLLAIH